MDILIVGAGIGGLAAALCAAHFGHRVTVLERADALREIGAGIQLPPNAMRVFRELDLEAKIARDAFASEAIQARMGESGRTLFTIPLAAQAEDRWGAPYLHIHRADYVRALAGALERRAPGALRLGAEVARYRNVESAVEIELATGEALRADVLIGADGVHSGVRAQMLGPDSPRFTGNVAWRAVVPVEALGKHAPAPTACAWMGRGRHAVTYRLRGGRLANFVGVVERHDWPRKGASGESWTERGSKTDLLADFAGWHPVIRALVEAAPEDGLFRWALLDRAPLPRWTDGRAALLGDAAHPMLPFLAQGAAMAVEDAWVLARELSRGGDVGSALSRYEHARAPRTARAQAGSRANMGTFHQRTAWGRLLTYGPMWLAGRLAPSLVHRQMDWLYGFDVTA